MKSSQQTAYGIRTQVANYFERQAEYILGQSHAAAALTSHNGLLGLAGEEAFRSFLRSHLPGKYGIGTGHVVSHHENSAQVDTVIYDSQECFTIPITETSTLFSVEGVYAVIEVKSSPSKTSNVAKVIQEAVLNIESVHKIVHPIPFSMTSNIATVTNLTDFTLLHQKDVVHPKFSYPVSAILILGTGSKFDTVVKNFRRAQSKIQHWHNWPNLLCVLDEKEYGLCGFDFILENNQVVHKFWRETCHSQGETLSTFLYWLAHKMAFERIIELPIFYNQDNQAIWPSVIAPVVRRIKVDVDESGSQRSWPWPTETRVFEL